MFFLERIKIAKELLEEKELSRIVKKKIIESLCNLKKNGNLDSIIEVIVKGLKEVAILHIMKKESERDSNKYRKRKEELEKEIDTEFEMFIKVFKGVEDEQ